MTLRSDAAPVGLCPAEELRAIVDELGGLRVTLMGLGLFGGGAGAARFLAERGARVLVTDLRSAERLAPSMALLESLPLKYRLGEHRECDFTDTDLVVANPAVPRTNRYLHAAASAGVPVTSPMNIFLTLTPAPVAAVTGSNGKSTTTSLLVGMVANSGRKVWLGGNIGVSLLPFLSRIRPSDLVVLEMSSFQLEDARALGWSPRVAVVTNITPNHLDRHGNFDTYVAAKRVLLDYQDEECVAALNARDPIQVRWAAEGRGGGRKVFFSSDPDSAPANPGVSLVADRFVWRDGGRDEILCCRSQLPLPGLHNAENAMAATAAAKCLGLSQLDIRKGLERFPGLEHRLELVAQYGGLRFFNDSDSTTPESGIAALRSFGGALTLIAGGSDKRLDLRPLARAAAETADVLITMGVTGPRIAQMAREESAGMGRALVVREVGSLEGALCAVKSLSMPGSAVVFSPSCPSYDMFENFRQRGEAFKKLVRQRFGESGLCA